MRRDNLTDYHHVTRFPVERKPSQLMPLLYLLERGWRYSSSMNSRSPTLACIFTYQQEHYVPGKYKTTPRQENICRNFRSRKSHSKIVFGCYTFERGKKKFVKFSIRENVRLVKRLIRKNDRESYQTELDYFFYSSRS